MGKLFNGSIDNEKWKDIPDYEGIYQVSNLGRIKSKMGIKTKQLSRNGYEIIMLYKNCKWKNFIVHRIVAQSFILNPENKSQVNHVNGIKTDNRAENLEWVTCSENHKHAFKMGLKKIPSHNADLAHEANKKKVIDIITGKVYPSLKCASIENNIEYTKLHTWLAGKRKINKSSLRYM